MRIAASLLGLALLGCQSSTPAPNAARAGEPTRVVTSSISSGVATPPRRPLTRLNPRRQRLEVGEAPRRPRPRPQKVGVVVISSQIPVQGCPPAAPARARSSQARVDPFMAHWDRPRPGVSLTPEMLRLAYPQSPLFNTVLPDTP